MLNRVLAILFAAVLYPFYRTGIMHMDIMDGHIAKTNGLEWIPNGIYAFGLMVASCPRAYYRLFTKT